MTFQPKTDEELAEEMVWSAGIYNFEVQEATLTESNKGNNMLALKLLIFDGRKKRTVRDWLVEADHALCLMKLRHYCRATGAMQAYESGDLSNFPGAGAAGRVKICIEEDDKYGFQNRVKDYVAEDVKPEPPANNLAEQQNEPLLKTDIKSIIKDDEIPF